jgi:hypothetical protein
MYHNRGNILIREKNYGGRKQRNTFFVYHERERDIYIYIQKGVVDFSQKSQMTNIEVSIK